MTKAITKVAAILALSALAACSKSSSDAAAGSSTFSISGTMGGLSLMSVQPSENMSASDYALYYAATGIEAIRSMSGAGGSGDGSGSVSAQSNQCADGGYYRVLCASWSVPPASAYGDVNCSGANSGSFTVSGLPLNTEISCFVRKSTDGTTFKPFATLELPATSSMSGATDMITSSGDMQLGITVGTGGSLTVSVTSGSNSSSNGAGSAATDTAAASGFYVLSCDAAGNTEAQNVLCKCFLDESVYADQGKEACINAGAAGITSVSMPISLSLYNATVNSNQDFNSDGTNELTAGQTIQGVTVWGASGTCTSASNCTSGRGSGGEGATHFSMVTSADSTFSTAIAWQAGSYSCGTSCTFTVGAIPANNASQATWYAWLQAMVDSAADVDGPNSTNAFKCTNWSGGFYTDTQVKDHSYCISNFVWQVYDQHTRSNRLPRIRFETCSRSGTCSDTPAATMMGVEGLEFVSGTPTGTTPGAQPGSMYVFEQWQPLQGGAGGSFRQSHEDGRWLQCLSGSGTDSSAGIYNCPSGANGVQCYGREEMSMKLLPTGTANVYNLGFSNTNAFNHGVIRGGTADGMTVSGTFNAYDKCQAAFTASSSTFVAKGTKLQ